MRRKFLLSMFMLLLCLNVIGVRGLYAQSVAKIGNTEYATIDEAIAKWTNGTTLTLLADVTLSDVIKLSSTEHHILDLGAYTMTAASKKDAIQIVNNGRSSASYALDIKADATNPGGITATGKAVVRTAGKSGVKDRPIIRFYNGVFDSSYIVYHSGSNGTNCPQFWFYGGVFNGTIYTNRTLNQFYGGIFNGSMSMSVDSSAYTLVAGGTFKNLSNTYGSALNSGKFTIGSAKGVYDKEVYIDDNGNYVIAATEPSEGIEADVAKNPGTNEYLYYSKVKTEGQLGYTDVYTAIDKNKSGTITVYVDELDLNNTGFTGTIVVPEDHIITITNAPANLNVVDEKGNAITPNEGGTYTTIVPDYEGEGTEEYPYIIADIDDLNNLRNKVNEGEAYEGKYFELTEDITLTGEWTPIGNGSRSSKTYTGNSFKGVFDGKNNTISGLTITSTTADDAAIGLFGVVDGGTVKNLTLDNVNINVSTSDLAGAAVGMMLNGATADYITVSGTIIGYDGVGGIVGRLIIDGTISNCINNASVTSSYGGIGGIVGKAYYEDGANTSTFASVIECTNNGTITAPMYVGGIVGLARANVTECVNNGAVVGGTQTGGIIGQLIAAGEVSANKNKAKISGTNHLGGIIGDYSQSTAYTYYNVSIENNINRGEVSATQCAAIMGCNNIDGFTDMTATGNVSYYYVEGLELFGNPEDMVIDETNKFIVPVAKIGDVEYSTLAEAVAEATEGETITMLADAAEDVTIPAGVSFNGNGKAVGNIIAAGTITFNGHTKATSFNVEYANTTVNIVEGACLEITGAGRMVIGHGCTFNITGTIAEAKTANVAELTPSLIMPGASFTGAGVTFNVTDAYINAPSSYCSSSKSASGTFVFKFDNSIWESAGKLAFESQSTAATVNFELKDSKLTTGSHLVFGVSRGEVVIDNSNVNVGTSRQIENQSTMTIKNGSVVNGAVATSSNAKNPGTLIVDNATYAVTGEFSGSDLGTGTIVYKNGATISAGSITKANIQIDATGMAVGNQVNITANLTNHAGTIEVINNNMLDAKIVDGKIVIVEKPVAKIGDVEYTTLEDAFKAATSGCTIEILENVTVDYAWDNRYTGSKFTVPVTINGNDKTIKFTASVNDNNYQAPFRFQAHATVNNLIIDMSEVTDNRFRAISSNANLTVNGCKFIGKDKTLNCRAIIFGEGAGANVGNLEISITNSEFSNWKRGITDNENAQDVMTVTITANTLTSSAVYVSAKETVTFTGNTVSGAYVNIRSYSDDNNLSVTATGNTLEGNTENNYNYIYAKNIEAQEEFVTKNPPLKVSTKDELSAAINAANDGDVIEMTADIDYGTDQLAIAKAITLDLGGKTLTTRNAYGGMSIKNNPTIKNGKIVHASNTAAIKVWNATAFEDLVIDVQGKGDANKTIGGIVLQSGSTTRVGSIKNVTIEGDALTNGIETYNCGDATENVIGSMENVNIDAVGTAMLISAPCGTATNCTFDGDVNGIEIWIKGNYSASLGLVDCDVVGGVFAHDEFSSNPEIVNNGTLNLTADEATSGAGVDDVTLTLARAEHVAGVLEDVMEQAEAKVNNTYYQTLQAAIGAAQDGEEIDLLKNVELTSTLLLTKNNILDGNSFKLTPAEGFDPDGNNAVIVLAANMSGYEANRIYTVKNLTIEGFSTPSRIVRANFCDATIQNCLFDGNASASIITSAYAVLNVEDNIFTDNTATGYAVIDVGSDVSDGTNLVAKIIDNTFENNQAAIAGIFLASSADVTDNHFKNNTHTGDNANAAAILAGPYTGNMAYTVNINSNAFENAMSKDGTALPSVFAEDWSSLGSTTSFDLSLNYWDGNEPEAGTAYKTSGDNPQVTVKSYYTTYADGTLGGLIEYPQGNDFTGYTRGDAIWGEVWGNAKESFVIKVLDANGNEMGTTSLNNVDGIINGNVTVTWSLKLDAASNTDEYWTMSWTTPPTIDNMPAKVELWVDDDKVSGGPVVLNGPDNINRIYAAVTDNTGKILAYHTNVQEAIKAAAAVNGARTTTAGTVEFLADVTVDEWIMFSETLSIGNGQIITIEKIEGLTIDGNNHTLTINSIESAGNGNRLFYDATNLNIKDLTINYKEGVVGGIGLTSGTISNVTFNGGVGVLPGDGDITISGCTFKTSGSAIYNEEERDKLVVTGNTFETADGQYAIYLRGNTTFTDNTVITGKVNVVSGSPIVTGNDFGEERFKVYNAATATISENTINNLVFNETNVPTESTFTNNTLSAEAQAAIDALPIIAGEGTEENPYLINDISDLEFFRDDVNAGNNYAGKYVKLTADIDLNNEEWTPIGNDTNKFQGYFDGNEKTISNLKVTGNTRYKGFFGYIKGTGMSATTTPSVKDLTLDGVNVNVEGDGYFVGGLAGQAYTCNITKVTVKGNVSGVRYVGGLVGHVYTYFKDCHFIGNASCSFDALGGIAGAGDCRAYDCSVIGDITGSNWVGGIVGNGQEGTSAVGCYVKGDVKTSNNYYRGVGGIAGVAGHGYASSEFKNNYFDGEVYLEDVKVPAMIMGLVNADDNASIKATVEGNSWNTDYYDVNTPVYVVAEISSSNASLEDWIDGTSEELTKPRNNNLVMLESDIQYVDATDINDVTIMIFSEVTVDEILPQIEENNQVAYIDSNADGAYNEGETKYTSLQDALNAGGNVTVLRDIALTEGVTVAADKTVVLDLKGKTITGTPAEAKAFAVITNKGDLTITDGTETEGKIVCDHKLAGSTEYAVNTITNSGTLTIVAGTIQNTSTASNQIGYAIDNNSTTGKTILVIEGGEVTASGSGYYDGIRQFCNSETNENSVTIKGGEVSSLWLQNPSDGSGTQNTKDVKGSFAINGGTLNNLYLEPSTQFAGAIICGHVGNISRFQTAEGRDLEGFISGGTFSSDVSEFCAEGFKVEQNTDGTYGVVPFETKEYVIDANGEIKTLADAIAKAKEDGTDIVTYTIYGAATLETGYSHGIVDFGGREGYITIKGGSGNTRSTDSFTITGGGVPDIKGVTFKDLTFYDEGTYLPTANEFMYQNFIDCTFENVTFEDGIRLSGNSVVRNCTFNANTNDEYAIWLDKGTFEMTGSTVTAGNEAYGLLKSDVVDKITISGNTFQYLAKVNKEALNVKGATIVATGNKFIDCAKGIVPADKVNYTADGTTQITDAIIAGDNEIIIYVAKIGGVKYQSLAEAATAATTGQTIQLLWAEGHAPIAMAATIVNNKTVTITGTANVDWSKGWLYVGRNGEGNGKLIFNEANLTSKSVGSNSGLGLNVSCKKNGSNTTNDGKVEIINSNIQLDYLIGKGDIKLDNSTLNVYEGFAVGARPASETGGVQRTVTMDITNGSKVIVDNHNGQGLGYESNGIMNIDATSTFETQRSFLITADGTMNVNGGNVKTVGTLTNKGTVNINDATVEIAKLDNDNLLFISGENTLQVEDASGSSFALRARDGVVFNNSYVKGTANETMRLLGSATFNGGFVCAYLQGKNADESNTDNSGVGGTITIEEGTKVHATYGVEFSNKYVLNGGTIELSGGNASGNLWGFVFQNADYTINSDIVVNGLVNDTPDTAPIHFTNVKATVNGKINQSDAKGEVIYLVDSEVTFAENSVVTTTTTGVHVNKGSTLTNKGNIAGKVTVNAELSNKGEINGDVTVNGTLISENNITGIITKAEAEAATIIITGGTYKQDVNEWCHEYYDAIPNGDGTWTVEQVMYALVRDLQEGWSWFSSFINIDGEAGLTKIKDALGENGVQVKDAYSGSFIQYSSTSGWKGLLKEASSKAVYSIKTIDDGDDISEISVKDFTIKGTKVDPSLPENTVYINKGWNYIAYPLDQVAGLGVLSFTPAEYDVIKSKESSSMYISGVWVPNINMTPGEGYMYKSNDNATKSFNFAYPTRSAVDASISNNVTNDYYWSVNAHKYPGNMTIVAMLNIDNELVKDSYEIAAFANGECRGRAQSVYVESLDTYVLVLTVHGEDVENITFKYYDVNSGAEYELSNIMVYSNDAIVGSADEPYMFNLDILNVDEASVDQISIYPNPTTTGKEINLQAVCDKVEVFNALGVKVAEYTNVDSIDAIETAGVYVIRVTIDGNARNCRLIVK